jgi:probable rRNA maturation factor
VSRQDAHACSASQQIEVRIEEREWRQAAPDIAAQIRRAAVLSLRRGGRADHGTVPLTILFADDERLRALNRAHRGKDKPTNVLSFPTASGSDYLGDIAIAFGVARQEAEAAGKPLGHHAIHLAVHGVLHLLGYDHANAREAEAMEALETEILAEIGIPDPYRRRGCAA